MTFTVISQKGFDCPYCEKAIDALDSRGIKYSIRALDRADLLEAASAAGMDTVPIIYQDDKLIGGYNELEKHLKEMV